MTMILMILSVYVTEEFVWVGEISNFCATKFWNHRQDTENMHCVSVSLYYIGSSIQTVC